MTSTTWQKLGAALVLVGIFVLVGEFVILTPSKVDQNELIGRTENVTGQFVDVGKETLSDIVNEQADMLISGFHYLASEGGREAWEMIADKARIFKKGQRFDADQTEIKIFSGDGTFYRVFADRGIFNTGNHDLELIGHVRIYSNDEYEYLSDRAFYVASKNLFYSNDPVTVTGPLKDPHPIVVHGLGFQAHTDTKTYEFTKSVDVKKDRLRQGKKFYPIEIKAKEGSGDRLSQRIHFKKDVWIKQGELTATSEEAELFYGNEAGEEFKKEATHAEGSSNPPKTQVDSKNLTNLLKYMVLSDDVVLRERIPSVVQGKSVVLLREATCQKAEFFGDRDQVLMTGNPRLKQGKDVMVGDRILLYRGQELVEVESVDAIVHLKDSEPNQKDSEKKTKGIEK